MIDNYHSGMYHQKKSDGATLRIWRYWRRLMAGIFIFAVYVLIAVAIIDSNIVPVSSEALVLLLVIVSPLGSYVHLKRHIKKQQDRIHVWKKLAQKYEGRFDATIKIKSDAKAAMLREGELRQIGPTIIFTHNGKEVLFFRYRFNDAYGNLADKFANRFFEYHRHSYYVIRYTFGGAVPHMYLNYKHNVYNMSLGTPLHIPTEFEKQFSLSVPDGYNLEGHEIFTPDILSRILDLPFICDVELVDQYAYFFLESYDYKDMLLDYHVVQQEIETIHSIVDVLKPKLDHFRFAKVGDKSFYLK